MGGLGKRPDPPELKVLKGVGKKDPNRINRIAPKITLIQDAPCPDHLSGLAREAWVWCVDMLRGAGLLDKSVLASVESYAINYQRFREAQPELDRLGITIASSSGNLVTNPAWRVSCDATDRILRALAEMGLTPSSRSRVQRDPRNDQEDGLPGARVRA